MLVPPRNWFAVVCLLAGLGSPAGGADHRDTPIITGGGYDATGLYVFRSPANANNTVFIITVNPFAGSTGGGPVTFATDARYQLRIDSDGDQIEDLTYEAVFGAPESGNVQPVTVRRYRALLAGSVVARGATSTNLPVTGGGTFRAGPADDPTFVDEVGVDLLLNGGAFPRPVGTATNRFGPNFNVLALVLEVPSISAIGPSNSLIQVVGRVERAGAQVDFAGRPFTSQLLIPPVPRGSNFPPLASPANRVERRAAFNASLPRNHLRDFKSDMVAVFQNFFGRNANDANALAALLLPDGLTFQLGNPNGYGTFVTSGTGQGGSLGGTVLGNGRRLRDDVFDVLINISTNGAINTDNVADDNATRITDGNSGTTAAFPYIGAANASPPPAPTLP